MERYHSNESSKVPVGSFKHESKSDKAWTESVDSESSEGEAPRPLVVDRPNSKPKASKQQKASKQSGKPKDAKSRVNGKPTGPRKSRYFVADGKPRGAPTKSPSNSR